MLSRLLLTMTVIFSATGIAANKSNTVPAKPYGDVQVEKVLRLDPAVQIYCDLKDMPPIIGQNIPVCIKGLKPSKNPKDNLELLIFLNDLLLSKSDAPHKIILKNIERGETFCLLADIEIDGRDLCNLLVQKNLVNKVIEVPSAAPPQSTGTAAETTPGNETQAPQTTGQYIASKSSKVYHRVTCPHAKRMDKSKAVYFNTREEAEATGRRPCKTCKP